MDALLNIKAEYGIRRQPLQAKIILFIPLPAMIFFAKIIV